MTRDDDTPENTLERSRRFDANATGNNVRQEPSFSDLDDLDEDGYEEPDRDTNLAAGYRADSVEEEDEYDHSAEENERSRVADYRSDIGDDVDASLEDDDWLEPDDDRVDEGQGWPLGMIVVGLVALVLLAAGGYGVLQQRAATQEELRELRAALAVAGPQDAGDREALQSLQQSYDKLSAQAQALTLENRRLSDTVAGLEAQLGSQQSVPSKAVAAQDAQVAGSTAPQEAVAQSSAPPAPAAANIVQDATTTPPKTAPPTTAPPRAAQLPAQPKPAVKSAPAKPKPASSPTGPWFVNFGTYATRSMADTWASRVRPTAGEVIVAPNDKDGRTLYRVRVVGLGDRESAQQVARKLESDLQVPPLWVGRE